MASEICTRPAFFIGKSLLSLTQPCIKKSLDSHGCCEPMLFHPSHVAATQRESWYPECPIGTGHLACPARSFPGNKRTAHRTRSIPPPESPGHLCNQGDGTLRRR